jgi:hypothetical protein
LENPLSGQILGVVEGTGKGGQAILKTAIRK